MLKDVEGLIRKFSGHVAELYNRLPKLLVGAERERFEIRTHEFIAANVPPSIAARIASTHPMYSALNIIEASVQAQSSIKEVAASYFTLADVLELSWYREQINMYPVDNRWAVLARAAAKGDLDWQQRALTVGVLRQSVKERGVQARIDAWLQRYQAFVDRWHALIAEMRSVSVLEFTMLAVATRELSDVARSCIAK